ncbi:hypothetical protein HYV43_02795 [Candidatus Micrarchaeota archaeon]|nr:hypothetical protein [Candidatus Micrarchaeota archaeon]
MENLRDAAYAGHRPAERTGHIHPRLKSKNSHSAIESIYNAATYQRKQGKTEARRRMDSVIEVLAYLAAAYVLWDMIRNPDSLKRLREPWVRPIKDLGQK